MGVPTLPDLGEAAASALGGTVDSGTGIKHSELDVDDNSTPSLFSRIMNLERKLMLLLEGSCEGKVVWSGSGLNVGAYPLEYQIAGVSYSFAGDESFSLALPASQTSYVYLDTDETLKSQTGDWPSADHFKLATVTTNVTQVTGITDMRWHNIMLGIINAWCLVLPTTDIDFNVKEARNLGSQAFTNWAEVTISGGAITRTQALHTVDTESDAATDDLDTITAQTGSAYRRLLFLRAENAARVVTVKDGTGNITLLDGDCVLDDADLVLCLLQDSDTTWVELFRNRHTVAQLQTNLDANSKDISNIGTFNLKSETLDISSGAITPTKSRVGLTPETWWEDDDLTTINGGVEGDLLELYHYGGLEAGNVTVKHNAVGIQTANEKDFVLTYGGNEKLTLRYDGVYWQEIGRSRLDLTDLVDTSEAIPYPIGPYVEDGALATGTKKWRFYCFHAFTLKNAHGELGTAPSGGACVVDILDDGASIFNDQSEMVNIADGTTSDTSATKNHVFAAGSVIEIQIEEANSAADLTLTLNGFIAPKTPPT